MIIKTKYEVGQHIWIVYEKKGEVGVYDDYISSIDWEDYLYYMTKETCEELKEDEIILYDDLTKLAERIKEIMEGIKKKVLEVNINVY